MKRSAFATRVTSTSRDVIAGCFVCHGMDAHWHGGSAQGTAARHHDATGHATWCDVAMSVRYGIEAHDPRQIDIEDAITSTFSGPASLPARHSNSEAPAVPAAGVSNLSRPVRKEARGTKTLAPETPAP
ncbi:hypothetical protein ACVWYO_000029 [Sphingomonas sp. UYP23]